MHFPSLSGKMQFQRQGPSPHAHIQKHCITKNAPVKCYINQHQERKIPFFMKNEERNTPTGFVLSDLELGYFRILNVSLNTFSTQFIFCELCYYRTKATNTKQNRTWQVLVCLFGFIYYSKKKRLLCKQGFTKKNNSSSCQGSMKYQDTKLLPVDKM